MPKLWFRVCGATGMPRSRDVRALLRSAALLGLLLTAGLSASSVASSRARLASAARPEMLHLRWRLIAKPVQPGDLPLVRTNERYIATQPEFEPPTLTDTRTGRTTHPIPPGCSFTPEGSFGGVRIQVFGGPYLVVDCFDGSGYSLTHHLLNLARGTWSSVVPAPALAGLCQGGPCGVAAVGARWIEFAGNYGHNCGLHDCGTTDVFEQNLRTGQVRANPIREGGRSYDDPDAASGVGRLCSPLRFPPMWVGSAPGGGAASLTLIGSLVLEQQMDPRVGPSYHLERCLSNMRLPLNIGGPAVYGPAAVAPTGEGEGTASGLTVTIVRHPPRPGQPLVPPAGRGREDAVVWTTGARDVSGLYLPSLRRFSARTPGPVISSVAVSGLTLLVTATDGKVWAAKLPTPRLSTHQRVRHR